MRLGLRQAALPSAAVALGMVALLVAGCGSGTPSSGASNLAASQVFTYDLPTGASGDIATLDPDMVSDANSTTVINLIYDGLVTLDKNLNVEAWGAKSWDVSSDGLTYTFHLRTGQSFSDGKPVTSADYAYSINRADNPCLASPVSYYLFEIADAANFASEACTSGVISAARGQTTPLIQTLIGDLVWRQIERRTAAYLLRARPAHCRSTVRSSSLRARQGSTDRAGAGGPSWLPAPPRTPPPSHMALSSATGPLAILPRQLIQAIAHANE